MKYLVIGGMGTYATLVFFQKMYENTNARKDQDFPEIYIINKSNMPDRTNAILNGENTDEIIRLTWEMANEINVIKPSRVMVLCNTYHYFIKNLKQNLKEGIEVVEMPKEALIECERLKMKSVTVFSTTGTKDSAIYDMYNKKIGGNIVINYPEKEDSKLLMNEIYSLKQYKSYNSEIIKTLIKKYLEKTDGIILGCTELSVMNIKRSDYIVDAMDISMKKFFSKKH